MKAKQDTAKKLAEVEANKKKIAADFKKKQEFAKEIQRLKQEISKVRTAAAAEVAEMRKNVETYQKKTDVKVNQEVQKRSIAEVKANVIADVAVADIRESFKVLIFE